MGNTPPPSIKRESHAYFKALGAHIALLRKTRDMIRAELARAIGVSQQAVFAYELGERRVSVLIVAKLSRVFAVSVADLIGMTRPPHTRKAGPSPRAIRHAELLQTLSTTERRFILRIIDILVDQRSQMSKPKAASSATGNFGSNIV